MRCRPISCIVSRHFLSRELSALCKCCFEIKCSILLNQSLICGLHVTMKDLDHGTGAVRTELNFRVWVPSRPSATFGCRVVTDYRITPQMLYLGEQRPSAPRLHWRSGSVSSSTMTSLTKKDIQDIPLSVFAQLGHNREGTDAATSSSLPSLDSLFSSISEFTFDPEAGETFPAWYDHYGDLFQIDAAKDRLPLRKLSTLVHK